MSTLKRNVSLITYNIHKGYGLGRLRFLLPEMRESLSRLNPDFLFLQEVQGLHKRRERRISKWPDASQFEYIAENSWPHFLYAKNAVYQSGHHGNAILSKFPFSRYENINLSSMDRASRSILHGQVDSDSFSVHLVCVHLGLFKAERATQFAALIAWLNETIPADEPLIMAGDFNDWRHNLSKPLASELGIEEAFFNVLGRHARSFPAITPALCMDRIYFRNLRVKEVCCLQGKPWRLLSDHVPLFARFELL